MFRGTKFVFALIVFAVLSGESHAVTCDAKIQPERGEPDVDLVICGDALPSDIQVGGLDEADVSLLYKQPLKQCDWDDNRPGFHLVLKSESAKEGVTLPILNTETGEALCDLTLDFPEAREIAPSPWADALPEGASKTIDVGGIDTFYYDVGEGTPLIMVHGGQTGGFNNDARKWMRSVPGLSDHFRVIALDRLGQGKTDNLPNKSDYPNYYTLDAEHLAGFMDALNLKDAVLVGHSQGGWPITRVALDRPDLVSCLVNVDTVMVPDDRALMMQALKFIFYVSGQIHPKEGPTLYSARRGLLLRSPSGNNVTLDAAKEVMQRSSDPKIAEAAAGMNSMTEGPGRLNPAHPIFMALKAKAHEDIAAGKLKAKSLVVFGEKDYQVPLALGKMFNQMLEESGVETKFEIISDAGHAPFREFPNEFNDLVINYCGAS